MLKHSRLFLLSSSDDETTVFCNILGHDNDKTTLQLAQRYAMLTQDGIIADVRQRECRGPEDTKSLTAITGPACDLHQWAQEPFQLRLVPPVLGWATSLAALGPGSGLRCSWPFNQTRQINMGPDSSTDAGLGMSWLRHSLSPRLVLPLPRLQLPDEGDRWPHHQPWPRSHHKWEKRSWGNVMIK